MFDFIKRNWFFIVGLIILGFTVFYVFIIGIGNEIYIFNHKPFIVASGSMEPEMQTHALAVIAKEDFDQAQVGEIAVFRISENGQAASHRIIEITENGLITKGDNNPIADMGYVTSDNYIGSVVWHSNEFASYFNAVTGPNGVLKFLILPILAIIAVVFLIKSAIKNLRKTNSKK